MRSFNSVESFAVVFVAFLALCIRPDSSAAQQSLNFEPYSVFVAQEEAFAYCGPSEEYYRTDPLRYGQTLDVYAETDTGWLGIRPPENSFCWVPAETVELDSSQGQGPGTVIEDRTVAWIGTQLGRARRFRWQVQLAKGEPVMVLGSSEREGPDGPQLWYRIVPPSGEYRWVHRDNVVMSSEELVESVRKRVENRKSENVTDASTSEEKKKFFGGSSNAAKPQGAAERDEDAPRPASTQQASLRGAREAESLESESRGRKSKDPEVVTTSGRSILEREEAIGSGLREPSRSEPSSSRLDFLKQGGLLASLEFLTRPQIQEIGVQPQTAPAPNEIAADSNWVTGATRPGLHETQQSENRQAGYQQAASPFSGVATAGLGAPISSPVSTAIPTAISTAISSGASHPSGSSDWAIADRSVTSRSNASSQSATPLPAPQTSRSSMVTPAAHSFHVISSERVAEIEREARGADVDRLNLLLSRLMAAQGSAAETEPVERAAQQLASGAIDPVVAGRARMLVETAQRYQRIATLRDGNTVIQANTTIPFGSPPTTNSFAGVVNPVGMSSNPQTSVAQAPFTTAAATTSTHSPSAGSVGIDHGNGVMEQRGYLVQVYSARSNSPPFALTDHAGRTVAYVTPVPGVNLRPHLNSHISVVGNRGYLTGLNMPHVMATQAVRTPE